jgi:hypothetical protein
MRPVVQRRCRRPAGPPKKSCPKGHRRSRPSKKKRSNEDADGQDEHETEHEQNAPRDLREIHLALDRVLGSRQAFAATHVGHHSPAPTRTHPVARWLAARCRLWYDRNAGSAAKRYGLLINLAADRAITGRPLFQRQLVPPSDRWCPSRCGSSVVDAALRFPPARFVPNLGRLTGLAVGAALFSQRQPKPSGADSRDHEQRASGCVRVADSGRAGACVWARLPE